MRDARGSVGVGLILTAILVAALALITPQLMFKDDAAATREGSLRRMKGEASHWSSVPALHLQVSEVVAATSATELPDGVVTWRTLFGVPYGETLIRENQSATRWNWERLLLTMLGVAVLEASLVATGVRLIWTSP